MNCLRHFAAAGLVVLSLGVSRAAKADEFDDLQGQFQAAQNAWFEKMQAAQGAQSDGADVSKLPPNPAKEFMPKFKAYAEKHTDTLQGMKAMTFMIQAGDGAPGIPSEDSRWALDMLEQKHAANPEINAILGELRGAAYAFGRARMTKFFESVMAANKDKGVLAQATLSLGATLYESMDFLEMTAGTSKPSADARAAEKKRALELFRKVVADYGDSNSAKLAKGYIFEVERLQPGMKAPEIVGRDENDKEIRLSQFFGQVVMLDFWGFW